MSYSHIIFCGDSYMHCYTEGKGHLQLAEQLNAEPVVSVQPGSGHEYVANRIYDVVQDKPKCLIIWGLTHPFRLEVPYFSNKDKKSYWVTLNYDHLIGRIGGETFEKIPSDFQLNSYVEYLRCVHNSQDLFMKKALENIAFISTWLTTKGHDCLIFNQAATDYEKIKNKNWAVINDINRNPSFYKIFEWYMNQYLLDSNVPFRKSDCDFFGKWMLAAHPVTGQALNDSVNSFFLTALKDRKLI